MRMMGPLMGADARAYRHPLTAARAVLSAANRRIKVYRKGRDNYFFNESRDVFASAASGEAGSTAIT
jgi:hypothetical protein